MQIPFILAQAYFSMSALECLLPSFLHKFYKTRLFIDGIRSIVYVQEIGTENTWLCQDWCNLILSALGPHAKFASQSEDWSDSGGYVKFTS
jgi:hypothetical protein